MTVKNRTPYFPNIVVAIVGIAALFCIPLANAQELHVFFGNLHSHTSYSDGSATPEDAYTHARVAGVDFLAITEHNHGQAGRIANDHTLYSGANPESSLDDQLHLEQQRGSGGAEG